MGKKVRQRLYELYRSLDIVTSFMIARLRCAGHVQGMNEEDVLKRIIKFTPERNTGRGRSKLRWIDGILEYVKILGVKNWWTWLRIGNLQDNPEGS